MNRIERAGETAAASLAALETPCLLLDVDRLRANCARMLERTAKLGVKLRPHLKTAKSLDVARIATGDGLPSITVSTLKKAECFAEAGYRDILYAAGAVPQKFAHVARIQRSTGCDLMLVTDALSVARAAADFAAANDVVLSFLIEIDCGEHRSGLPPTDPTVVEVARTIAASPKLRLRGVMTHAGHSYGTDDPREVAAIASVERDAAVTAASAIRGAGLPCEIVSVGSTPTVLHADHLAGVTEARAGIYMVWDLAQLSRNMCREDEIAVSVLASVIGHNRQGRAIILDAGALALSKDVGANRFLPDAGYGYVCDARTLARHGRLAVDNVHQEHGTVAVDDETWFERLPVGSLVRVLPNHACITCAAHDVYAVVQGGAVIDRWARINGW
jgi:D-serine deaminase-like pyridoxal phosphate-dependent protein